MIRSKLSEAQLDGATTDKVLDAVTDHIIPAGTKGVIRGLEYNRIVQEQLSHYFGAFSLHFEEKCPAYDAPERPDWWLHCQHANRYIIGYNQVDLWVGGAQRNRANKYLSDKTILPPNVDVLCVVSKRLRNKRANGFCERATKAFAARRVCYTSELVGTVDALLGKKNDI